MDYIEDTIKQLFECYRSYEKAEQAISILVNEGISVLPRILNAIRNGPSHSQILLRQVLLQINDSKMQNEMLSLLEDKDSYIRSIAYRVLGKSNDPSVSKKLEEHLLSDTLIDSNRISAARALGDGMHFNSLPVMKRQLEISVNDDSFDYSPDLILAIAYSMVKLGDNSALPYVLGLCQDEDRVIQLKAVKLLRFFSGKGVHKQLKGLINNSISEIRKDTIDALFLLGTKDAAQHIWKLCKDVDADISQHATLRLTQITGKEFEKNESVKDFNEWLDESEIMLNNEYCFRSGYPINVPLLVKKLTESKPTNSLLEELYVITGNRFGHDPEVWIYVKPPDYNVLVNLWLNENQDKYLIGNLYKFGFLQDINLMQDCD